MWKGEIAHYEQFLLFPQCFQKASFPGVSKGVIVWEWVKLIDYFCLWQGWKYCWRRRICRFLALSLFLMFSKAVFLQVWENEKLYSEGLNTIKNCRNCIDMCKRTLFMKSVAYLSAYFNFPKQFYVKDGCFWKHYVEMLVAPFSSFPTMPLEPLEPFERQFGCLNVLFFFFRKYTFVGQSQSFYCLVKTQGPAWVAQWWACQTRNIVVVRRTFFLPLISAEAFEKSSRWLWKEKLCQYWTVRKLGNTCATQTAVKVALNPNTTNQRLQTYTI